MTFAIVTDSATDVDPLFAKNNDIVIIPTELSIGGEIYNDFEISKDELIERIKSKQIGKTSRPTPESFIKGYSKIGKKYDSVIAVHISSVLSSTINGSNEIKMMFDNLDIRIIDSLSLSLGAGYLVQVASYMRDKGYSIDETEKKLNELRDKVHLEILIDDPGPLNRSGRINVTQFVFLNVFSIKLILNIIDGKLVVKGSSFGIKRGIRKIVNRIILKSREYNNPIIIIGHANTPKVAEQIKKELKEFTKYDIRIIRVSSVLICHAGPGVIGIGIMPNHYNL